MCATMPGSHCSFTVEFSKFNLSPDFTTPSSKFLGPLVLLVFGHTKGPLYSVSRTLTRTVRLVVGAWVGCCVVQRCWLVPGEQRLAVKAKAPGITPPDCPEVIPGLRQMPAQCPPPS